MLKFIIYMQLNSVLLFGHFPSGLYDEIYCLSTTTDIGDYFTLLLTTILSLEKFSSWT